MRLSVLLVDGCLENLMKRLVGIWCARLSGDLGFIGELSYFEVYPMFSGKSV